MDEFGLIAIHRNRLDALEHTSYAVLEAEEQQIDIVGSTIFGLKGTSRVTPERVLDLLRTKMLMDKDFVIRILLTHCEVLSTRQDQERNVKAPDRYVISNESLDAIERSCSQNERHRGVCIDPFVVDDCSMRCYDRTS